MITRNNVSVPRLLVEIEAEVNSDISGSLCDIIVDGW